MLINIHSLRQACALYDYAPFTDVYILIGRNGELQRMGLQRLCADGPDPGIGHGIAEIDISRNRNRHAPATGLYLISSGCHCKGVFLLLGDRKGIFLPVTNEPQLGETLIVSRILRNGHLHFRRSCLAGRRAERQPVIGSGVDDVERPVFFRLERDGEPAAFGTEYMVGLHPFSEHYCIGSTDDLDIAVSAEAASVKCDHRYNRRPPADGLYITGRYLHYGGIAASPLYALDRSVRRGDCVCDEAALPFPERHGSGVDRYGMDIDLRDVVPARKKDRYGKQPYQSFQERDPPSHSPASLRRSAFSAI